MYNSTCITTAFLLLLLFLFYNRWSINKENFWQFVVKSRTLAVKMRTKVGRGFPVRCLTGFLHDSPEGEGKKENTSQVSAGIRVLAVK